MEQKEKNEQTETKEEKKTKTNLELKDTELDQVSGGNYGDTSFFSGMLEMRKYLSRNMLLRSAEPIP